MVLLTKTANLGSIATKGIHLMTTVDANIKQTVRLDDVITTVVMARVTDYFGFFVFALSLIHI